VRDWTREEGPQCACSESTHTHDHARKACGQPVAGYALVPLRGDPAYRKSDVRFRRTQMCAHCLIVFALSERERERRTARFVERAA